MYQIVDSNSNLCDDVCVICYHEDVSGNSLVSLSELNYVSRKCKCEAKIHKKCVIRWYVTKGRCILCNTPVVIRTPGPARRQNISEHEHREVPMDSCTRTWLSSSFIILLVLVIIYICFADNVKGFVLLSGYNKTNDTQNYLVLTDFH